MAALTKVALTKADLFNNRPMPVKLVDVPDLGGHVYVRTLTAAEKDAYEASQVKVGKDGDLEPQLANASGNLAALVICDEQGRRLFEDDDAGELGRLPAPVLAPIVAEARKINGMNRKAVEDAKGN